MERPDAVRTAIADFLAEPAAPGWPT